MVPPAVAAPLPARPTTQAYITPARGSIYATAAPGPGVPALGLVGDAIREVGISDPVAISVKAIPGAVVTFATADGGRFRSSGLDYETVTADTTGIASATWECTPGTSGDVHIAAASPACGGRVNLLISLLDPKVKP